MEDLDEEKLQEICSTGEVSASLIQLKFKVGYSMAAKIMDKLEEEGIIEKQENQIQRKILDKEKFLEKCRQYYSENSNNHYSPNLKVIMNNNFPSINEYVKIAETLVSNDCFAKKIDEVLSSKFLEKQDKEERRESFHLSVYGNYCRGHIVALIVNDFISNSLKENLNNSLDEFWLERVKKYKSFLEEKDEKSNENNESV